MQHFTTSLLAALLLSGSIASAQTTYRLGVRGGFNQAETTVDPDGSTAPRNSRIRGNSTAKASISAWQVGAVVEIRRRNFAFQPALLFSQKGEEIAYSAYDSFIGSYYYDSGTNRYNWLELPLDLVYTPLGDHGLQLLAGPYLALAVGGRHQGTRTYTKSANAQPGPYDEASSYDSNSYNQRFDAGFHLGMGYRQGPVQVQVGYSWGVVNLHKASATPQVLFYAGTDPSYPNFSYYHDYQADAAYNRVLQLTATYFFKR